jgi:ribosome-associated translation inhibitor RaiA
MHQSPQKQITTRRERNAVYAAFEMAEDAIERRPQRIGAPRVRKQEREEGLREERLARSGPRG